MYSLKVYVAAVSVSGVVRGSRGITALYRCFWITLLLYQCYLKAITVIPLLSTIGLVSVITLHKMECLTFSCLTLCIKGLPTIIVSHRAAKIQEKKISRNVVSAKS